MMEQNKDIEEKEEEEIMGEEKKEQTIRIFQ